MESTSLIKAEVIRCWENPAPAHWPILFGERTAVVVATHCLYKSSGRTKHEERDGLKAKSYNNYVKDNEYCVEQYQEVEQEQ